MLGGPSVGKSRTAAWLYSELKELKYSVELVGEYVKPRAYQNVKLHKYDQIYIFGKQLHYEYRYLCNGVDTIITDSPTILSAVYAKKYIQESSIWKYITDANHEYALEFPSLNILLRRDNKDFDPNGRFQTFEESCVIDKDIMEYMEENEIPYIVIGNRNKEQVLKEVVDTLSKNEHLKEH